jgi:GNAT superfamily N-acetyltransferase
MTEHVLDNPAFAALTGPQAAFAERSGDAVRFPADVSPFGGIRAEDDASWANAATLVGPAGIAWFVALAGPAPQGWEVVTVIPGVQMVDAGLVPVNDPEAIPLGPTDVPEMLDLVARTRPGPFLPRTVELGGYLGIRREGNLIAMAGNRLRPPGWAEISAVCTDERFRGEGLGTRLVLAVAAHTRSRGETPFLHAAGSNVTAIRLYESLGFKVRRTVTFTGLRAPAA